MRRIDQSVSLVQLQLGEGPCSPGTGRQRSSCCNSRILHTGTTQHRPNAPFRSDMAAAWAPFPPSLDPLGPNFGYRAHVADSMRRAENIHFWLLLPTFFALHGGSCKVMLPRLGVSGPPTQDQVAHVKPNLRPNVRKLRHVGPQLLEPDAKFSASSTQSALVGPSRPAPIPSVLFPRCVAKRLENKYG